jgi:hypothetical protein
MIKKDARKVWAKLFGYCPHCKRYFRYDVRLHRRLTNYKEYHLNFLLACRQCRANDDFYFKNKHG